MHRKKLLSVIWVIALCSLINVLEAQVSVSKLFTNGAVLQRNTEIHIWGWGNPGATITIQFADSIRTTTVTAHGSWSTYLPSFEAGGPYNLSITDSQTTLNRSDLLVGDVYLISGQSNMEMTLYQSDGGPEEASAANYPEIREFKINKSTSKAESEQLGVVSWKPAVGSQASGFSAVGYYFAKNLYAEYGVPIGLLNNSYGGARIEAFMSEAMLGFDEDDVVLANGETERQPTLIFNKMVNPILPFNYSGIVWYQAESNGDSMEDALAYGELFKTMITSYRDSLNNQETPFIWVQLPAFYEPAGDMPSTWDAWPQLRAQQSGALSLPFTGEAITIDVGDVDIHPTNKKPVGERLALLARNLVYGEEIVAQSPRYRSNALTDSGAVEIQFYLFGDSLVTDNPDNKDLNSFALAGENGQFKWAQSRISNNSIIVWHEDIPVPTHIRYAWEYNPGEIDVFNSVGLPLAPFQAEVNPGFKIGSFNSSRTAIEQGQSAVLSWLVYNARLVTLDGAEVDTSGSISVSPTMTTSYELIAFSALDSSESDTSHLTLQVLDPSELNRTYGRPVTASTYETCCGDPLLPEFATDEDLSTRWSSAWSDGTRDNPEEEMYDGSPDDEWITVDLQQYIDLDQVILNWEAAYGSSYDINISLVGYQWKNIYAEREGNGGIDSISFNEPATGRYLQMRGIERATVYGYSLYEFQAYGITSLIQPPQISIYSPTGNFYSEQTDSVLIKTRVTDENGSVDRVSFLVNGDTIITKTDAEFEFYLQLNGLDEYQISAIATDNDEISIQSAPLTIYVPHSDFTVYEAEEAVLTGGATVQISMFNSGGEFVDARDAWTITFPSFNLWGSGEHLININYQLTYESPKSQYLVINGDTVATLEFNADNTSDWINLAYKHDFERDYDNTIAIHGFWNWMSFDYIQVEGVNKGLTTENNSSLPAGVRLYQNYPNPFNPTTQISFDLPVNDHVQLIVFDMTGRVVSTLLDGSKNAGSHTVPFDASTLASGIYFYQLKGSFGVQTRSLTLIR